MATGAVRTTPGACLEDCAFPAELTVFSTCPSSTTTPDKYLERVATVARWSDDAGCAGMLVYTDNSLVDPWLISQSILQNTRSLAPLVAVQPVYMHPYAVAKMVSSLAFLYGRRLCLNMVAGGFKNDQVALNDLTPHDSRYERLLEYALIIKQLLEGGSPVTFHGRYYRVTNLTLHPPLPRHLFPQFLISGSSAAGLSVARALGAVAVKYPEPPDHCEIQFGASNALFGVRIGIIARENADAAWRVALERFPEDRKGQLTHQLAMKTSDSAWHERLSEIGRLNRGTRSTYWLEPFENYKTFCPYLVGSYEDTSAELARYVRAGYTTYILDIPSVEEDLKHASVACRLAAQKAAS